MEKNRKSHRIKIHHLSRIRESQYDVVNISREGLMVCGSHQRFRPEQTEIELELRINHRWIPLRATIVWSIVEGKLPTVSMGLFITEAPTEYQEYIENLYLETEYSDP